jgi:hypothetical protein
MLHAFHLDVAKVYQNVALVAVAIHVYFECIFKCFISFFKRMFVSVSYGCCICFYTYEVFQVFFCSVSYACFECFSCFVRMLQVFYLDDSKVDLVLQLVFTCVSSAFRDMLQVLHLNVSKVVRCL